MVLFFFVVALEVKRELVIGELGDRRAATVPVLAALGGVALPAVIFLTIALASGERGRDRGLGDPDGDRHRVRRRRAGAARRPQGPAGSSSCSC